MNWSIALPEIALAVVAMAILVFGVLRKQDSTFLSSMFALGGFLLAALLVLTAARGVGYHGQFVADAFSSFIKILVLAGAALSLILSLDYNKHEHIDRFEFPVLMVLSVTGMMVMASAANLMTLYLGLELQSLALYVLAAFARDNVRSSEAGLKYFVLGALASGLLLYGISLVYGFSGTMDFAALAKALSQPADASPGLIVGIVFVLVGLAFKISAVPFHMWTPDVYEGSPTPVTVFFSTAPKVAAMALLLRTMATPFGHLLIAWQQLIVLVSIASMLLGSLAAIGQHNIKRLMAYSSIGHMGYALIGLAVGTPEGIRGVLIYLVVYVFMSAGTFACIIAMRRRGRALEEISDLSGLARTDPGLALALAVFMFSMAGIPPLSGFFGKLYVFLAAVQGGMWTLAVIGVLTSVIGAYYYLRVVKVMYFDAPEAPFDPRPASLSFVAAATCAVHHVLLRLPGAICRCCAGGGESAVRMKQGRFTTEARRHREPISPCLRASVVNLLPADAAGHRLRQYQRRVRRARRRNLARQLAHPHRCAAHIRRIRRLAARSAQPRRTSSPMTSPPPSSALWCRPRCIISAASAATTSTSSRWSHAPRSTGASTSAWTIRPKSAPTVWRTRWPAHQRFGGPLIVVDFGTATTFDVVDKDGAYLGGVICPGINLSLEALHQAAARLPRIGIGRPQAVIGRSTVPAMQSGLYWGYVGMIEGLVGRIKAEYGGPMKVIATGGLAPLFAEGTLVIEQIEPDLTLDGLRMLAERNPAPTLRPDKTRLIEQD